MRINYHGENLGPEIFDDPVRMSRNAIDLDIADYTRLVLGYEVDLDDRAAVERVVDLDPRNDPEFNVRYVDQVIRVARLNKADWDARRQQEEAEALGGA